MRSEFLPFSRPSITEREIEAVNAVMRSGWITTGKKVAEFEARFAESVGSPHAVSLASATAGMHLVLKALGVGPGDEVITPSMTWVSTVNLISLCGATPVFADIDRDTLMVTEDAVRARLSPRTRLIIPVHYAGAPTDLDGLRRIAAERQVPLLEDAAHAAGTGYRGRPVGAEGTAIFSFHPIKNITTGEGGMVCTDDAALSERVRRLRFHGLGADAYDRKTQGRAPQAQVLEPGYKYNLTDMAAAMGLVQLERLGELNTRRAELAALYNEKLSAVSEIMPLQEPTYPCRHAWHLYIVRLDIDRARLDRDGFMEELKSRNVGTGLHFRAVHTHKFYRETRPDEHAVLPNTEWNSERMCSLPLFPDMTEEDVEDVVSAIKEVLAS